jgi:hypothetical protein
MALSDRGTIEVPILLNQQIAAADPGRIDFHQDFVWANFRHGHLAQFNVPHPLGGFS